MSIFRVDTVPTPRLDLYAAFAKDMQYFLKNKQNLPPMQRSALAAEQEKINKFLQYVNEAFIMKGFSKYNPVPEIAVDSDVVTAFNEQQLQFGQSMEPIARFSVTCAYVSHLYIQWSLSGSMTLPPGAETNTTLQVQLFINGESAALWRQDLEAGERSLCQTVFLPDRSAGAYAVEILARVDRGSLAAPIGGAYASAYAKLKTAQM